MFSNLPAFHDAIKAIQNFFHDGIHDILTGLSALATSIAQNGGGVLLAAAASAVAAAEAQGGTGSEKLASAQAAVMETLTTAGIPVVMNAINGAIEAAVAQHKANVAAAVPVAGA